MPDQQATTPVSYTDPLTGKTQMGYPIYNTLGKVVGFTPVTTPISNPQGATNGSYFGTDPMQTTGSYFGPDATTPVTTPAPTPVPTPTPTPTITSTPTQQTSVLDALAKIPQNTINFYKGLPNAAINAETSYLTGAKATKVDTSKPVTYTDSQTGLVIQGAPVLNAAGKVIGFTPVGVTPTASQTQAMTANANAVQNDFTTTTANDVSRSDLRATLDGANTASSVAMAASPKDPRYHPLSNYQPKVETQPDGTKIVTIEGSYLNDMMKNFYKAGAASAKVEVSPVTNAAGQSITGQNTVATAGLVTAPDNSRTSSPTGAQQIYADNYTPVTTQHILDQLKSNPANSKMSTADILAALTRK